MSIFLKNNKYLSASLWYWPTRLLYLALLNSLKNNSDIFLDIFKNFLNIFFISIIIKKISNTILYLFVL